MKFVYTTEILDSVFLWGKGMEYITIKEVADRWNISERRIQILCHDERIVGAKKWKGLCNSSGCAKTKDGRVTTGKYRNWRSKQTL